MVKTEKKTIGKHTFLVTQLNATDSLLLKAKLVDTLGSSILLLSELKKDNEAEIISKLVSAVFKSKNPEEIVDLIKNTVIKGVACDGKNMSERRFEEIFSGDSLIEVYQVFIFVIFVNFSSFIEKIKLMKKKG